MLNFPNAPTPNQVFTGAGRYWIWDNVKWVASGSNSASPVDPSIITIHSTTSLAAGFTGLVLVENTTGNPMVVTLPAIPALGQAVSLKDALGNSSDDTITINGNGSNIDGLPTLLLQYNYSFADLVFTGTQWGQAHAPGSPTFGGGITEGTTVYVVAVEGGTMIASSGVDAVQLEPAAALAAYTVVLPPAPVDTQEFTLSTTRDISALTVTPGGLVGVLAGNGSLAWRYRASNARWYRV